jgi:hypothetical protein
MERTPRLSGAVCTRFSHPRKRPRLVWRPRSSQTHHVTEVWSNTGNAAPRRQTGEVQQSNRGLRQNLRGTAEQFTLKKGHRLRDLPALIPEDVIGVTPSAFHGYLEPSPSRCGYAGLLDLGGVAWGRGAGGAVDGLNDWDLCARLAVCCRLSGIATANRLGSRLWPFLVRAVVDRVPGTRSGRVGRCCVVRSWGRRER